VKSDVVNNEPSSSCHDGQQHQKHDPETARVGLLSGIFETFAEFLKRTQDLFFQVTFRPKQLLHLYLQFTRVLDFQVNGRLGRERKTWRREVEDEIRKIDVCQEDALNQMRE